MKKIIVAIVLISAVLPACKKKKVDDTPAEVKQVVVPDEYNLRFTSSLDLKKNSSGFDTVLSLASTIEKYSPVKAGEVINAVVKCNNFEVYVDESFATDGTVNYSGLANFQRQLSPATWSVVCNETGNFTYSDSALVPSFPNAHSISIDTIKRYEDLVIDITGAQNYDGAYMQVVSDLNNGAYNESADPGTSQNHLVIGQYTYDTNTFFNIHHVLLRIIFYKNTQRTINGKQITFTKQAIYNYNCILK